MQVVLRFLGILVLVILFATACNDPFYRKDESERPGYRVVRDNPTEWKKISDLIDEKGSDPELYVRLNRSGYEVREYPVEYRGMDYYDIIIALKHTDDVKVGHGDSGSPIVDGAGRVVAALYAGDPTNKEIFFARPIEEMTARLLAVQERDVVTTGRQLLVTRYFTGIKAETLAEICGSLGLPREECVFGRASPTTSFGADTAGLAIRQTTTPIAGQSILLRYLDGNIFRSYISGTVTYVTGLPADGQSLLVFGHGVFGDGRATVPAYLVSAVGFIESELYPYKVIDPFSADDNPLGFLVEEAYSGAKLQDKGPYEPTLVESSFLPPTATDAIEARHVVAPTTRSTQDHYFQTMAILSPLIYEWQSAYNQDEDVAVRFGSFTTSGGAELAAAGGIAGVLDGPLAITHVEYLAAGESNSYLGYIVVTLYDVIREAYRTQPSGTRFGTIKAEVTVTN